MPVATVVIMKLLSMKSFAVPGLLVPITFLFAAPNMALVGTVY
jgi:hypothetical protein